MELRGSGWLIYQFFKRDFLSIYKQSFMGVMWAVIIPVVSVGTFIVLRGSGVFSLGEMSVPYPVFAILGMAFWQLFASGLIAGSNVLVKAGPMIVKINFSRKSLVLASMGQALVSFLIQILLLMIVFMYFGFFPRPWILLTPLFIIPILLLTVGLGFILSLLNGIMRDIGNVISIFMTFFMFLTPVLYPRPDSGVLATISRYNPLYYFVAVPREMILSGRTAEWPGFAAAAAGSVLVFLLCIVVFHLTETRVAERI